LFSPNHPLPGAVPEIRRNLIGVALPHAYPSNLAPSVTKPTLSADRGGRISSGLVLVRGYRQQLRTAVAASAAPYGYTLTVWTAGAVTSHAEQAFPSPIDAL